MSGIIFLTSCQVRRPGTILSDDKMEAVLYDYHIAKVMGDELSSSESYKRVLYIESVYKKHGITKAEFDSSMVWFSRNPDILHGIYEKVNIRLRNEKDKLERLISLRDDRPMYSLSGDSVDVWMWRNMYCLYGIAGENKLTFTLPSDSNFYDRDTLAWSIRFTFKELPADTSYLPVMAMQMVYENDSIIDTLRLVRRNGMDTLRLSADTLGRIRTVRGFVYCPANLPSQSILLDCISLKRYHAKDTLHVAIKDSIQDSTSDTSEEKTYSSGPKSIKKITSPPTPSERNLEKVERLPDNIDEKS